MNAIRYGLAFVARSVVVGLALAFVAVWLWPELLGNRGNGAPADVNQGYANAVARSAPAVVNVWTARWVADPGSVSRVRSELDLGSAVIIDADGHLVTNFHVIREADELWVQLPDGRSAEPRLIGSDPETDIALLKVDIDDLPPIALGRSDTLAIGDIVLAIGNPYGLTQTVTQGIVSATGRGLVGLTSFENYIQTDAAINRGNSGGALINTRGELVGINTATLAEDQSSQGISFAIPVNLVRGVVRDLIQHGRVIRGWLGLVPELKPLSSLEMQELGIPETGGILLERVYVNGPGYNAGLRRYDVITELNGKAVSNRQQALLLVAGLAPGTQVEIRGYRGSQAYVTEATVGERPITLEQ